MATRRQEVSPDPPYAPIWHLVGRILRRRRPRIVCLLATAFGALTTSACAPVNLLNAAVSSDGVTVERGISYGDDPRRKLDIYVPDGLDGPAPVVVFFYGGSWRTGERDDFFFVGEALTTAGFVTVIPDYRLYPGGRFPAFVEDGAAAIAWVQDHIAEHGGKAGGIHIVGHSAGAHIAALLALDPHWIEEAGGDPDRISSLVGLAGPYDFLPIESPSVREVFASAETPEATQPITFAGPGDPPALLLTGADDTTVYPRNSKALAAKLEKAGVPVRLRVYPDMGHIGIITSLAAPFRSGEATLPDIKAFIDEVEAGTFR